MAANADDSTIKIGYMPLAHEAYWRFFPEFEEPTQRYAREFGEYLSQFGTVCETGELIDSAARSREARLHFQAMDVDILILATVTYSTPDDVLLDLKRFERPIIVWNTQASAAIPADMNWRQWMFEHGVTGVPGLTNLLEREGMPYFLVSGHHTSEAATRRFRTIVQALAAFKGFWGAKIGMFGHLYPGMIDFGYDPTMMFSTFGVATVPILGASILEAFKAVDQRDVDTLSEQVIGEYSVDDDFEDKEFESSVRLALAMRQIVRDKDLAGATVYCQSMFLHPDIGVVSCLGMSLLMQEGIFCSCEGDVLTGLAGIILEKLSGKALFTEIWCNDFQNDQFMMGHSGTMNLSLFETNSKSVEVSRHPWWRGCAGHGACLQVRMPPGPATLLGISHAKGGKWRFIVSEAEVVDRAPVPLGAPNFFVKMGKPIDQFLEDLGEVGAAHHLSMAYGNWTEHLKALAEILNIEYVQI